MKETIIEKAKRIMQAELDKEEGGYKAYVGYNEKDPQALDVMMYHPEEKASLEYKVHAFYNDKKKQLKEFQDSAKTMHEYFQRDMKAHKEQNNKLDN